MELRTSRREYLIVRRERALSLASVAVSDEQRATLGRADDPSRVKQLDQRVSAL